MHTTQPPVHVFWFRRDLRLEDNAGLYEALRAGLPVLPLFIFDTNILDQLPDKSDARVGFIHASLERLHKTLRKQGSGLFVLDGSPEACFKKLCTSFSVRAVFTNHDYEPYALERDARIKELLEKSNAALLAFKDQVIFEKQEVVKEDGKPYTVFTPYSRKWKQALAQHGIPHHPSEKHIASFLAYDAPELPSIQQLGFKANDTVIPPHEITNGLLEAYAKQRDMPGIAGTSRLGIHLRFGTLSVRALAQRALQTSETFLNELIWRDFYHMILWHYPQVGKGKAFKAAYDQIEWRQDEASFEKWCQGKTGYPMVDAGMRELNATGFMHNRVRMITASFLCKHLLIDWRWGESYFAAKLLDFDMAANNGGWQWAAGSGCDAAPYFRIFNPTLQTKKFDPNLVYIKKWVPELETLDYPAPIVQHELARKRCLETYTKALKPA